MRLQVEVVKIIIEVMVTLINQLLTLFCFFVFLIFFSIEKRDFSLMLYILIKQGHGISQNQLFIIFCVDQRVVCLMSESMCLYLLYKMK